MAVTDPDDFGVLEEAMDPDLIRSYTEAEITTLTLRNSERKELEAQLDQLGHRDLQKAQDSGRGQKKARGGQIADIFKFFHKRRS